MQLVTISLLSLFWCFLFISTGISTGWLTVTTSLPWLLEPGAFIFRHLRLSLIPFGILLLAYLLLVTRIRRALNHPATTRSTLSFLDRILNTVIGAFFGVGVIWTAVGMESALISALNGLHEAGGGIGPQELLDRLVNGGLLLALSTTIFGGSCGYLLRILKITLIGSGWDRFMLNERKPEK